MTGQITGTLLIDRFDLLGSPTIPVTATRLFGAAPMGPFWPCAAEKGRIGRPV